MLAAAADDPVALCQPARSAWIGHQSGFQWMNAHGWPVGDTLDPSWTPSMRAARGGAPNRVWGGVMDGGIKLIGTCPGLP